MVRAAMRSAWPLISAPLNDPSRCAPAVRFRLCKIRADDALIEAMHMLLFKRVGKVSVVRMPALRAPSVRCSRCTSHEACDARSHFPCVADDCLWALSMQRQARKKNLLEFSGLVCRPGDEVSFLT